MGDNNKDNARAQATANKDGQDRQLRQGVWTAKAADNEMVGVGDNKKKDG